MDPDSASLDYDAPCVAAKPRPHEIRLAAQSRLVVDSAALNWPNVFASIVSRRAWSGRIEPTEHLGFVYCLRGMNRVERTIEGEGTTEVVEFRAREIAVLPSRAPAWYKVRGDADVLAVYLRGAMLRSVADRLFGASTSPLHFQPRMAVSDPLLEQICLAFAAGLYRRATGGAGYIDQLAESAAAHFLCCYGQAEARLPPPREATEMQTALQRVSAYVDDHLDGDLSVETLACQARLTPSGLKRAFASVFGATPRQWIIERRIAHAERLIVDTDLPLSEVALRTGFASQSHLSSMFKRSTGRTPMGYRRVPFDPGCRT